MIRMSCTLSIDQYLKKWKMLPDYERSNNNRSSGFECNICLDLVQDPVVTFCGHLYCWPCIHRWMISFSSDDDDEDPSLIEYDQKQPQCPVCKTEVSEKTLIPLYGRGRQQNINNNMPQRPPSPRYCGPSVNSHRNNSSVQPSARSYINLGGAGRSRRLVDPMIGNSETTSLYTYPDSYRGLAGSTSPRFQRYMMETDESLSRVCFFLCCCAILCLLLF